MLAPVQGECVKKYILISFFLFRFFIIFNVLFRQIPGFPKSSRKMSERVILLYHHLLQKLEYNWHLVISHAQPKCLMCSSQGKWDASMGMTLSFIMSIVRMSVELISAAEETDVSKVGGPFMEQTFIECLFYAGHWASSSQSAAVIQVDSPESKGRKGREESKYGVPQRASWCSVTLWPFLSFPISDSSPSGTWLLHHAHCCYPVLCYCLSSTKAEVLVQILPILGNQSKTYIFPQLWRLSVLTPSPYLIYESP